MATFITESLGDPGIAAGAFRFRIAGDFAGKWFVEWSTHLRSRWFQMPYGDQAIFMRRSLFEKLGGFADLPIMEDYEFVNRLRRHGRIDTLAEAALTSGRRWTQLGILRTTLLNRLVITGYQIGFSVDALARFYRRSSCPH